MAAWARAGTGAGSKGIQSGWLRIQRGGPKRRARGIGPNWDVVVLDKIQRVKHWDNGFHDGSS